MESIDSKHPHTALLGPYRTCRFVQDILATPIPWAHRALCEATSQLLGLRRQKLLREVSLKLAV